MAFTTLFCLFPLIIFPSLPATEISFADALARQVITVESLATGGLHERSLELKVNNSSRKNLEVLIPAGFIFQSQDSSEQDLIAIRGKKLALEKGQKKTVALHGMCIQADHATPGEGSRFRPGGPATGNLAALITFITQKRLFDSNTQYALWAITDGKSLSNIDNEELRKFTAELLGKPSPSYTFGHESLAPEPGTRAFVPNPVTVRGTFLYQTNEDIVASFGLYNESGTLVAPFFDGQEQRRGSHRFRFTFEIRALPSGTYYARLKAGEKTIGEQKIEW